MTSSTFHLPPVRWSPTPLGSVLHALDLVVHESGVTNAALASELAASAAALRRLSSDTLPPEQLSRIGAGLACVHPDAQTLAEAWARPLSVASKPDASTVSALREIVEACRRAVTAQIDRHELQLKERIRPLREQWEARGPGLLRRFARLTATRVGPSELRVFVVYPFSGGDGVIHPDGHSVRIEGVLANEIASLPEIVRLAWLLGTQSVCAAKPEREVRLLSLAVLPAVLDAAGHVELARLDRDTLATALVTWRLVPDGSQELAERLLRWWEEWSRQELGWLAGLAELEKLAVPRIKR